MMVLDSFLKHWYDGGARLLGYKALIADVSTRTGQAIAVAFAREGAHVGLLHAESPDCAGAVKRLIGREGGRATIISASGDEINRWVRAMGEALRVLGELDILVTVPAASVPEAASDCAPVQRESFGTLTPSNLELIEVFAANAPAGVVVNGLFTNDDPSDEGTSSAAVARATWALDAITSSVRINAICIALPQLQATLPSGADDYLAEVAMGCVLLAGEEGAAFHGTVLLNNLEAKDRTADFTHLDG